MARILVVDDDDAIRNLLVHVLGSRNGYAVSAVRNGQEGLAIMRSEDFDLIITDLEMPELRGDEMLLRAEGRRRAIIMSGQFAWLMTDIDKVRAFPLLDNLIGWCTFLAKPFDVAKLETTVANLLAEPVE